MRHPLAAVLSYCRLSPAVGATLLGAALLFTGCSTTQQPLPGGVAPNSKILKSWSQGTQGNCVTIATIKAAQTIFSDLAGPKGIFKSVTQDSTGFEVVMRDGFTCKLTHDEVKEAKQASSFRVWSSKNTGDAIMIYACSAKRAQLEGNDGVEAKDMTFARALKSLNDGESVMDDEAFRRLGLEAMCKPIELEDAKKYQAVVVCNEKHAWFVTGGYGDNYGVVRPLGKEGWNAYMAVALLPPAIESGSTNAVTVPVR